MRRAVVPALLLVIAACGGEGAEPAPSGPNVILLVMDTTRGDRISATGYGRETTPNLAALLCDATVYTDAWSPSGWTGPAHASLFTGLRPENHGYLRGTRGFIMPGSETLARRFRDGGYATACFTNNENLSPETGLTQGFDRVAPLYAHENRPYPWAPSTHEKALDWATSRHREGRRFFLFINDMEPHFPYTPPEEERGLLVRENTGRDIIEWGRNLELGHLFDHSAGIERLAPRNLAHISDLYDAEILALDRAVGDLFARLEREGLLEDTIVVVTSDHGENLGDHGLMDHMFSLHRSICHVPLIIRYPELFPPGGRVDDVVRLEDVPPTLLTVCGLPPLPEIDGLPLLYELPGRVARAALGPPVEWLERVRREHPRPFDAKPFLAHQRSVYDGRYHLIRYSDGREELYDVSRDPEEKLNIAPRREETLESLRRLIED